MCCGQTDVLAVNILCDPVSEPAALKLFCDKHPSSYVTDSIATKAITELPANSGLCKGCYDENAVEKDELDVTPHQKSRHSQVQLAKC